ncbi:MAG: DUF5715 family protein [Leptospirales bacterium]|nr:DUF5715 family protein [Leptospirales bacterium]
MKRLLITALVCLKCITITYVITKSRIESSISSDIALIIKESQTDRAFIEKIPIYEDYANARKEEILRKYLFNEHYAAVRKTGMKPVTTAAEIPSFVEKKLLVPVKADANSLFYFYGLKEDNRFLAPATLNSLNKVCANFNKKLEDLKLPPVKIALSSALRPGDYQENLRKDNQNAALISTHSYGMSFDIFYDDYYVVLPTLNLNVVPDEIADKLRRRFGFILGDSLRRQLRTILFQTLIDMQETGEIYVTAEKNQRCYHITAIK